MANINFFQFGPKGNCTVLVENGNVQRIYVFRACHPPLGMRKQFMIVNCNTFCT